MATVFVINNEQMGHGDPALGRKILGAALRKMLNHFKDVSTIVLYNGGVKLAAKGSPVAADLLQLEHQGVELLACGTCVEYYGLGDQLIVQHPSDMDTILSTLSKADKVINL